jgi:phosphoribosylformimino-5-aminoimidazole carboxamide ribotide isomerase
MAIDLALRFEDAGAAAIIFTDIARDGMLGGLAIDSTVSLAARLSTPVVASGGVGSLEDLRALRAAASTLLAGAIEGVIVGRALYDGRIDIADALTVLAA